MQVQQRVDCVGVVQFRLGRRVGAARVVGAGGDLDTVLAQQAADRLDPEAILVLIDVGDDHLKRRSSSAAAKNAEAVLRISFARFSSAFSRRNAASSSLTSVGVPGR